MRATSATPYFEVNDLHKTLGRQHILRGATLSVQRGETLALIGPSGEGKSVLLKHLIGLIPPDRGSIRVDGQEIAGLPERQLANVRRKVGMLFQNGALFDSMTVEENVAFPLVEEGIKDHSAISGRVREALDSVDLVGHGAKMPIHLSGGQRKRVALARAIVRRPEGILYDEPTAGLDPIVADSIDRLVRCFQERYQVTSIVITHDMKSVFEIADRVAFLRRGTIYFLGTTGALRQSPDPFIQDFIHGRSAGHLESGALDAVGTLPSGTAPA